MFSSDFMISQNPLIEIQFACTALLIPTIPTLEFSLFSLSFFSFKLNLKNN